MQKALSNSEESSQYYFEGDSKVMPSPSMINILETNN